jgi:cyclopropane-fatty-acyl-phospholipid synthase
MNAAMEERQSFTMSLLEHDRVPDALIRARIRALLRQRLREEDCGEPEAQQRRLMQFVLRLSDGPLAVNTREANEQHYELPTTFFRAVLGPNLKYSCCRFDLERPPAPGREHLALEVAEQRMLAETVARARIADGERVLELGCGWGSLSLWMASRFPRARITAVSNSRSQKEWIDACARERGVTNLEVLTCDVNRLEFPAGERFDRVVSVEMFEHLRNWRLLFERVAGWLAPGGTLFFHVFTHLLHAYPFDVRDDSDWMARYFFTGGIMPSHFLPLYFQRDLRIVDQWAVDGRHYQLTSEAWLQNMDRARAELMPLFEATYGESASLRWWVYWRVFFMSCAELWGFESGRQWLVSHYLFEKPAARARLPGAAQGAP